MTNYWNELEQAQRRQETEYLRSHLEKHYNTEAHHKRDLLWEKAQKHGSGSGDMVLFWYGEFAEMLD